MPELPEVEVTRRSIGAALQGAVVIGARVGKPLRWPLGVAPDSLAGRRIGTLARRGKYLWMPLDGLPANGGLLWHLGMSGSLSLLPQAVAPAAHDHFDLHTSQGTLRLTDPRRFGAVVWSDSLADPPASTLLERLGWEPFDPQLTPARFHEGLRHRRTGIKSLLLGGELIVGAGNIYACEALFQAGIHPARRSDRIGAAAAARLLGALRETLARALDLGGSTLRDFRDAHGASGAYQAEARVYGRAGLACRVCGQTIRRIVQGQRSTYYCPRCQRH